MCRHDPPFSHSFETFFLKFKNIFRFVFTFIVSIDCLRLLLSLSPFCLTDNSLAYYHHANTYRGQFIFMKLSSTHLADRPLFPLKKTLIDSFDDVLSKIRFDIDHELA